MKLINLFFNHFINFSLKFRYLFYPLLLKYCGRNFIYRNSVSINAPYKISIGNNCLLNKGVILNGEGEIDIGNDVLIGPYSTIWSSNHNFGDINIPINLQGNIFKKTTIENNVWIGANCTILGGINIGEGSIVGAGSIVTKNIPPHSIVAGNPAKLIRSRI